MRKFLLALAAAAADKPSLTCPRPDAPKFKSRIGKTTCAVIAKATEPRRSMLCETVMNWDQVRAATACAESCRACDYDGFMAGSLTMAGPAAPPAPATGQAFRSRDVGPRDPPGGDQTAPSR